MVITILTIDSYNQGNRLQNYALSRVLERMGGGRIRTARIRDFGSLRNIFWFSLSKAKAMVKGVGIPSGRRAVKFLDFTHKFIPTIQTTPKQLLESEDIVVIGSDQCWNPDWGLGAREDGLQCAVGKAPHKKLTYAVSFGVSESHFSSEWKKRYGSWLESFDAISVREKEAVEIVRNLSGKEARLVLDPTMLLTAREWSAIEKKPKGFPYDVGAFYLEYLLGSSSTNEMEQARSAYQGMPVFVLTDLNPDIGPQEFLWLIHHSHAVLTDSFHGSVFSLIFHKSLCVVKRNDHLADMSSRFETLRQFPVFERSVVANGEFSFNEQRDWEIFDDNLAELRFQSIKWLEDALNGCR